MRVILEIEEDKLSSFFELIKGKEYIQVQENEVSKQEILEGLKNSIDAVNQHKAGKIRLKSVKELLNEL